VLKSETRPLYTVTIVEFNSQSWKPEGVSPDVWQHWLTIVRPRFLSSDVALLVLTKGDADHSNPPDSASSEWTRMALLSHCVVVEMEAVPVGPVTFNGEGLPRWEDAFLAKSFERFLDTQDPEWPGLLPMVKSAVRAMDAVQEVMKEDDVSRFVITGHSKRGWATYLTAAVDDRVVGIAPVAADFLNQKEHTRLQIESYGSVSEFLADYTDLDIPNRVLFGEPEAGDGLLRIVDPYSYRDLVTMPKLILLASGDDLWHADAVNLYFRDLTGPKHIHYEANASHGIREASGVQKARYAFLSRIAGGKPMPEFSFLVHETLGSFEVTTTGERPIGVLLWQAENPYANDFRLGTIGRGWKPKPVGISSIDVRNRQVTYGGSVVIPEQGYKAFYVELVYLEGVTPFRLSTPMTVLGD
jgi:PhoPQ-activated pathogenicity-related protein